MGTNNIECPTGYRKRKGYTRKFRSSIKQLGYTVRRKGKLYTVHPKAGDITVSAKCIKIHNSTVKHSKKLRKGELIRHGYQYRLSDLRREKALVKAVAAYGVDSVRATLVLAAKLSAKHAPDASKIFARDYHWVEQHYPKKK
jgi:hypothetical protein